VIGRVQSAEYRYGAVMSKDEIQIGNRAGRSEADSLASRGSCLM
jgi:hypothetical protein